MATDTQLEAYEAIKPQIPLVDQAVLRFIKAQPSTADEVVSLMGRVRNTVAPACTRLRQAGFIKDSGARRLTPAHRRAIVWQAA